jgi:tetratricopeptide (TPR) repeat protein
MTHGPRFLPLLCLIAVGACLISLSACKARDHGPGGDGTAVEAGEQFRGEPKVTADVHYATGQVFESKIATLSAAGKAEERQITQLRTAALSQYAAGLKLNANHTPSLHRSAALLSAMERHDQAIAMWERYVTATGRTPSSLVNLGLANEMAGRRAAAEQAYREATELDPSHKPAHVNLGILLARQGQLQPAQAALSAVLPPAAVHWHMGVALQSAGKMAEADQQFRAAAAIDPAYARRPAPPSSPSASVRE